MHDRLRPVRHRFRYPVFALRVDLGRLEACRSAWLGIDRWRPLSLRLRDYGPRDGSPLLPWIRGHLREAGLPDDGPVWLHTFPRLFGYAFNPVNFWYCHDADGVLRALLAEVNNTFGEHHAYLLAPSDHGPITPDTELTCVKQLHVSPFCTATGHYRFRFAESETDSLIRIDYHDADGLMIRTALTGSKRPLGTPVIRQTLLRRPWQALAVTWLIHWQALRLWWRNVPFHHKPAPPAAPLSHGKEHP